MVNKKCKTLTIDWHLLNSKHVVEQCAHAWVTDASIQHSLDHLVFDDPSIPHNQKTHRANRIASIIVMIQQGIEFDPIYLKVFKNKIEIHDGHHRLRAYEFLNKTKNIKVTAYGKLSTIAHAILSK